MTTSTFPRSAVGPGVRQFGRADVDALKETNCWKKPIVSHCRLAFCIRGRSEPYASQVCSGIVEIKQLPSTSPKIQKEAWYVEGLPQIRSVITEFGDISYMILPSVGFLGFILCCSNGKGHRLVSPWQDMTRSVTSGGRRPVNLNLSTQEPRCEHRWTSQNIEPDPSWAQSRLGPVVRNELSKPGHRSIGRCELWEKPRPCWLVVAHVAPFPSLMTFDASICSGFWQERLKSPAYYFLLTLWVEASWNLSESWCFAMFCVVLWSKSCFEVTWPFAIPVVSIMRRSGLLESLS